MLSRLASDLDTFQSSYHNAAVTASLFSMTGEDARPPFGPLNRPFPRNIYIGVKQVQVYGQYL